VDTDRSISIRPFIEDDTAQVRDLFVRVNRSLAPPHLAEAFEGYIARSLREEIDRIAAYYSERHGGFWVAEEGPRIVGMFGLELLSAGTMELRRMYVDPGAQRRGIARRMLQFAEDECRRRNVRRLDLSTSELQGPALSLYQNAGYELLRQETTIAESNKTVGAGLRRFYFTKAL
jgi:putative acetyltransferase